MPEHYGAMPQDFFSSESRQVVSSPSENKGRRFTWKSIYGCNKAAFPSVNVLLRKCSLMSTFSREWKSNNQFHGVSFSLESNAFLRLFDNTPPNSSCRFHGLMLSVSPFSRSLPVSLHQPTVTKVIFNFELAEFWFVALIVSAVKSSSPKG